MATPEAQEAAARERIIKHMNADHQDSIQRYLEVTEKPWFYELPSARMTDISLSQMKFTYGNGKNAVIPFDPPLKSLREARERVVQLDKDALQSLNRSSIPIKTFIPPTAHPVHLFNFTQCFITYVVFSRAGNLEPGSLLYDNLLFRLPAFAALCLSIRPYLISIMVLIHAFETVLMMRKLNRHGLRPLDKNWWLWVGTCFVEGITSFRRLDGWINERRKEKESKKH
ncbi:integral membrane protein-like protein [Dendryphion nanum]|uniref:Integral membrane protein-like protein n=1 Tax=Dendryphion nanum TaxID=256645 RepID=A0A9P9ICQ4_9PLEO|nr:integral membrane protein-like protein [Dendryphion nanum]